MRDFMMFVRDDRYSVPTLAVVTVEDEARAKAIAARRLSESPHHVAVEVVEQDVTLFRLEKAG